MINCLKMSYIFQDTMSNSPSGSPRVLLVDLFVQFCHHAPNESICRRHAQKCTQGVSKIIGAFPRVFLLPLSFDQNVSSSLWHFPLPKSSPKIQYRLSALQSVSNINYIFSSPNVSWQKRGVFRKVSLYQHSYSFFE